MSKKGWQDYPQIASSEITPESIWLNRRNLMKSAAAGAGMAAVGEALAAPRSPTPLRFSEAKEGSAFQATEALTPYEAATSYNNFYEFGTSKSDPARYADSMTTDPWEIKVGGLVQKPGKLNLEDILNGFDLEERIYRFRCVEAWSMSCLGSVFRCPNYSSGLNQKLRVSLSSLKRSTDRVRCAGHALSLLLLTGLTEKGFAWTRR